MKKRILVVLDGVERQVEVDTRKVLVDMLREDLGVTGAHVGCGTGTCGACTVMLDGRTVKSCCILAVDVDGQALLSIEGVAPGETLHPVQRALIDRHGIQCGFCTPGIVLSAMQLLNDHPKPSDAEIREAIAGNLCRCTGYVHIVEAIREAALEHNSGT